MTDADRDPFCVRYEDILAAREVLAGEVQRTPMLAAPKLSALTGAEVFVKYENMQVTNSFKDRGAFVKLSRLDGMHAGAA
jgi:threonine dehydratase